MSAGETPDVAAMAAQLIEVPGVVGVLLGGSRARGARENPAQS